MADNDKPHLVQDDTKNSNKNDSGLYDSNISGPVVDVEDSDDDDFQGSMTNPDKVEENSTLDMAHKMGLYSESSDDGEGSQGEVNVAQQFDNLENNSDSEDSEKQ